MLTILATIALIQSGQLVWGNLANQVIDVINANGFVPLSVSHMNQEPKIKDVANYINSKVRSERTGLEEAKNLVVASKEDEIEPLLPFLINGKLQMSILYFVGQIDDNDLDLFKDALTSKLKDIQEGFYFYLILESNGRLFWHHVISIQKTRSPVIGHVSIRDDFSMKEEYDLRGMTIKSLELPFPLYFKVECDNEGKNCKTGGYIGDIVSALATKLNFTWVCHRELNHKLGVATVSGPNNSTVTYDGVIGALMRADEYQMSVSQYGLVFYRLALLDFVNMAPAYKMLVMRLRKPDVDYGLFMRPFQTGPWYAIGISVATILAIFFVLNFKDDKGEVVNGRRAIKLVGGFFLILLSSYYCGALTMYFTSSPVPPFQTIKDVLEAHPEWTLKHRRNTHIMFSTNPDPVFAAYWNSIKDELEKYAFVTTKEAIDDLDNGKTIALIHRSALQHHLMNNPDQIRNLRTISHLKPKFVYMITSKGSPLSILLRHATIELEENGLRERIYEKYFGEVIRTSYTITIDSLITLSAGQVILIFLIMVTGILSILIVSGMEFFWKMSWRRRVKGRTVNVSPAQAGSSRRGPNPSK